MNKLELFQEKIRQWLHDPPNKAYALTYFGGHKKVAASLRKALVDDSGTPPDDLTATESRPDRLAAGADRPVVDLPGLWRVLRMDRQHVVTHPLMAHAQLAAWFTGADSAPDKDAIRSTKTTQEQAMERFGLAVGDWNDAGKLEDLHGRLWRRFLWDLVAAQRAADGRGLDTVVGDVLWESLPADTRCPDVSIWDHLRVTTATAFVTGKMGSKPKDPPPAQQPMLFRFCVRSPQKWINIARTGRDLWVTSFLVSELSFAAMWPLIEAYGPECIVYPDLRGNARVDRWLWEADGQIRRGWVPDAFADPTTYAALIPNAFVAILPQGTKDTDLVPVAELAERCRESLAKRWKELVGAVRGLLSDTTAKKGKNWPEGALKMYDDHANDPPASSWVAVPWQLFGGIVPKTFADLVKEGKPKAILPFQDPKKIQKLPEDLKKAVQQRRSALRDWVDDDTWANSEACRDTFLRVNIHLLQNERGFDYAHHHEMLGRLHEIRNRMVVSQGKPEVGEKCTQCGHRAAVFDKDKKHGDDAEAQREVVRGFWKETDPDNKGAERLCGRCTLVRYLVEAGGTGKGINTIWGGDGLRADRDGEVRVPFPSTATIAAQETLYQLAESNDREVLAAVRELVAASAPQRANRPRTQFPRSLRRLQQASALLSPSDPRSELFKYDAQILFPDTIRVKAGEADEEKQRDLRSASEALQTAMRKAETKIAAPNSQVAVIRLDGDSLGALLAGHPDQIGVRWKEVMFPEFAQWLKAHGEGRTNDIPGSFRGWIAGLHNAGWDDVAERSRLMGPSLHAFISRVLAEFGHTVVPWVTEMEFGGRLIYCGGDDVLAILPAHQALAYVTRLQQVYQSPWIVDTQPGATAWAWRRNSTEPMDAQEAQTRFVVPLVKEGSPLSLPVTESLRHPLHGVGRARAASTQLGRVIPMMGNRQSLSASVVMGHFKTDMDRMLNEGRRLLDGEAKGIAGKGALAVTLFSRAGIKVRAAARFGNVFGAGHLTERLRVVTQAFADGRLSGSLPYRLRDVSKAAWATTAVDEDRRAVEPGLFPETLLPIRPLLERLAESEGGVSGELLDAVVALWELGFAYDHERPAALLMLCRACAGGAEEES